MQHGVLNDIDSPEPTNTMKLAKEKKQSFHNETSMLHKARETSNAFRARLSRYLRATLVGARNFLPRVAWGFVCKIILSENQNIARKKQDRSKFLSGRLQNILISK